MVNIYYESCNFTNKIPIISSISVRILKFIYHGGPKSKVVLRAPTTSAPPLLTNCPRKIEFLGYYEWAPVLLRSLQSES